MSPTPRVFVFSDLEPATEYVAVFNGVSSEEARRVWARYRPQQIFCTT